MKRHRDDTVQAVSGYGEARGIAATAVPSTSFQDNGLDCTRQSGESRAKLQRLDWPESHAYRADVADLGDEVDNFQRWYAYPQNYSSLSASSPEYRTPPYSTIQLDSFIAGAPRVDVSLAAIYARQAFCFPPQRPASAEARYRNAFRELSSAANSCDSVTSYAVWPCRDACYLVSPRAISTSGRQRACGELETARRLHEEAVRAARDGSSQQARWAEHHWSTWRRLAAP
eukprot:scaffold443573_cov46-Prasinocladus_malaysianus.AAC.1